MTDDETRARAVVIVMQVFGTAHREEEWAHESAEAVVADLDAAGLLVAPAAQPAPFTDLTARLAAADAGWGLASGDGPSNPDYIRFLAAQVDAFEDHASPAAPAEQRRWTEGAPQPADNPAVQDGRGRVWVHDEGPWWTARDSNAHPVLQWAMLARVGITEVPSISDVAAPADDEAADRPVALSDALKAEADRIADEAYVIWRNTPNRDAYVDTSIRDAARRAALAALREGKQQ